MSQRSTARARLPIRGLAVTVLLAIVAAISLFTIFHLPVVQQHLTPSPAETTVANFYRAVHRQDYTAAYAFFAPGQQAIITDFAFTLSAKLLDTTQGIVTTYQEIHVGQDPQTAHQVTVQERVTRAKEGSSAHTYIVTLTVAQQGDGSWKIASETGI